MRLRTPALLARARVTCRRACLWRVSAIAKSIKRSSTLPVWCQSHTHLSAMSITEQEQRCNALRLDLKHWERNFSDKNGGRKAGREDIKADAVICMRMRAPGCSTADNLQRRNTETTKASERHFPSKWRLQHRAKSRNGALPATSTERWW